jgi:hypothetical protein
MIITMQMNTLKYDRSHSNVLTVPMIFSAFLQLNTLEITWRLLQERSMNHIS